MAKRFFYVCVGLFLLAMSYHLGANNATAQGQTNPIVATGPTSGTVYDVILANGDVYGIGNPNFGSLSPVYRGNIFGQPVQASPESWGAVKDRYRR